VLLQAERRRRSGHLKPGGSLPPFQLDAIRVRRSLEADSGNGLSFNAHVAALPPYNAGMNVEKARSLSGRHDIARLARNENPDRCSPAVMAALASPALEPWRYADPACTALPTALGAALEVDPERIVVGNGSEEMIAAVSRAMLVPDTVVVAAVPSFRAGDRLGSADRLPLLALEPGRPGTRPAVA